VNEHSTPRGAVLNVFPREPFCLTRTFMNENITEQFEHKNYSAYKRLFI